jgi:iron complex outermembrane receptor protein
LDWDRFYGLVAHVDYRGLVLRGSLQTREKGIPTAAWDMAFDTRPASSLDRRGFLRMAYQRPLAADKELALRASYDYYAFEGEYPYDVMWFDYDVGKWLKASGEFRWDVSGHCQVVAGAEGQRTTKALFRLSDERTTYLEANFPSSVWSLFTEVDYDLKRTLRFNVGVRNDNYSQGHHCVTPRAAVVWHPITAAAVKLLYGEGFRAPNPYELYYTDPDVAKGNPALQPERVRSFEGVWEQRWGKWLYGTACLFHSTVRDLIDQVVAEDSLLQFQNRQRVRTTGAEMELAGRLAAGLWWRMSYTYQHAEDATSGRLLTNAPEHLAKGAVSFPIGRVLTLGAEAIAESGRLTVQGTRTAPSTLVNIQLRAGPFFGCLRAGVVVRNLFDQRYAHPGGPEHRMAAIPQDGRRVEVWLGYGR